MGGEKTSNVGPEGECLSCGETAWQQVLSIRITNEVILDEFGNVEGVVASEQETLAVEDVRCGNCGKRVDLD